MADLTEEEKNILFRAHEIKERIRAEELEAGNISLEEAKRQEEEELREAFGAGIEEEHEEEEPYSWQREDEQESEEENRETLKEERRAQRAREMEQRKQERSMRKEQRREDRRYRREEGRTDKRRGRRRKRSLGSRILRFFLLLIVIIAILAAALYGLVRTAMAQTNYQPYETSYVRAADVASDPLVTNILLIGTDNREANDAARSDAMIILSINRKKGRISMTSVLRDSYVTIPGVGQNRLNHAYQMGGAALLIQTIEENFKIGIDSYVQVDFYNFIDLIDALGGVDIEVTEAEVPYIIGYVSELNHKENELAGYEIYPEGYSFLEQAGYQRLNGRQALAYSRIRYIGTDFGRTSRQRTVLQAAIKRIKQNPLLIIKAINSILPDLTTNIDDDAMTRLIMCAPIYMSFDLTQNQVPVDGCWWNTNMPNGQEVLGIDFTTNNAALYSAIYE